MSEWIIITLIVLLLGVELHPSWRFPSALASKSCQMLSQILSAIANPQLALEQHSLLCSLPLFAGKSWRKSDLIPPPNSLLPVAIHYSH